MPCMIVFIFMFANNLGLKAEKMEKENTTTRWLSGYTKAVKQLKTQFS